MSDDRLTVEVDATHLFPGAKGRLLGDPSAAGPEQPAIAIFADQSVADATLRFVPGEGNLLAVAAYTTARRTAIPAKAWWIELAGEAPRRQLRVRRRAR
jgi:hypothetical protein